eukprot:3386858-Rhodomonas_salina.1
MASSYGVGYILAAGQALFTKYNLLREEATQKKETFNDNLNAWTEPTQVKELAEYFEDPENGKVIMLLSIILSTVLKSTFGTTDVTNFSSIL